MGLHFPQEEEEEGQVHNQGRSIGFLCSLSLGRGSQRAPRLGGRLTQAAPHLHGPGTGAGCFPSSSILGILQAWVPAMPHQDPVSLSLAFRPLMGLDSGQVSACCPAHVRKISISAHPINTASPQLLRQPQTPMFPNALQLQHTVELATGHVWLFKLNNEKNLVLQSY